LLSRRSKLLVPFSLSSSCGGRWLGRASSSLFGMRTLVRVGAHPFYGSMLLKLQQALIVFGQLREDGIDQTPWPLVFPVKHLVDNLFLYRLCQVDGIRICNLQQPFPDSCKDKGSRTEALTRMLEGDQISPDGLALVLRFAKRYQERAKDGGSTLGIVGRGCDVDGVGGVNLASVWGIHNLPLASPSCCVLFPVVRSFALLARSLSHSRPGRRLVLVRFVYFFENRP
ncbi:hypothetical protein KCU92_g47, partial [Aureobasidium melanogenum]